MYFSHAFLSLLLAAGAVYLMTVAGVTKGALERRRTRVCPSCGRNARDCRCR